MTTLGTPTMTQDDIRLPNRPFRRIYLVQNRDFWRSCPFPYDRKRDLVLTFDFAVVREVTSQGGTAEYLDHLVKSELMERYNHETYHFFANWFLDKDKQDIFSYRGMGTSNALRLYIWTDITYPVHLLINLLALKHINYEKILVGIEDAHVTDMLRLLDLDAETWTIKAEKHSTEYYFPIFRWMHEQIYPSLLIRLTRIVVSRVLSAISRVGTSLGIFKNAAHDVFIQPYHPTYDIVKCLNLDANVNVVLEKLPGIAQISREKFIPLTWTASRYRELANGIVNAFHKRKNTQWHVEGIDIGDYLYKVILERATNLLPDCLKRVDEIMDYFSKRY